MNTASTSNAPSLRINHFMTLLSPSPTRRGSLLTAGSLVVGLLLLAGCSAPPESEVVVYTELDQVFAAPIYGSFYRHQEGKVTPAARFSPQFDAVGGTVAQIEREQTATPAADVLWDCDLWGTLRLQQAGLLAPRRWPRVAGFPTDMQASDGSWRGFAARARVLLINTDRLPNPADYPSSVRELADSGWQGRCAVANPGRGSMQVHTAVLSQQWGPEATVEWLELIAENAVVMAGNRAVAVAVSSGQVDWGLIDSEYAIGERDERRPVAIRFPDQAADGLGTLRIPNTVAILRSAPHPIAASRLVQFLASPASEERLAMGPSAQIPLHPETSHHPRVLPAEPVHWMQTDFEAAYRNWPLIADSIDLLFPQTPR